MKKLIYKIKEKFLELSEKTDDELSSIIKTIQYYKNSEDSEKFVINWFALLQQQSKRLQNFEHFSSQLLGGLHLLEGKIIEMRTGEGKTLTSSLPASFYALDKKGVHLITVNDYLAERDKNFLGKLYNSLGLSVGLVKHSDSAVKKRKNYNCDITYTTNSEIIFDYLRDNLSTEKNEIVQRPLYFCLLDEIDSILIDEASTPLIISRTFQPEAVKKLKRCKELTKNFKKDLHFEINEKNKQVSLTEEGYIEIEKNLGSDSLYNKKDPWILDILNALKAKHLFQLNKDYIILKNKICIIDEFTGRIMEDRRWSKGLHEAIEIKENLQLGDASTSKISITYQNFFPLYKKLCGMSGTLLTSKKEFKEVYNLEGVNIPNAKPFIRTNLADLVYLTAADKWKDVLNQAKISFRIGQPLLIGVSSIEATEFLSDLFLTNGIPHHLLNAKPENLVRENLIIAGAGKVHAITISTNMAGRGTDILLGGNLEYLVKKKIFKLFLQFFFAKRKSKFSESFHNTRYNAYILRVFKTYKKKDFILEEACSLPDSLTYCKEGLQNLYEQIKKDLFSFFKKEGTIVKSLGGLFVLATERFSTRRIDNQLKGRTARQGDPGLCRTFVSLEDSIPQMYKSDVLKKLMYSKKQANNLPGTQLYYIENGIEDNLLSLTVGKIQEKFESLLYETRKQTFEYDILLSRQRILLFAAKKELLKQNNWKELIKIYVLRRSNQKMLLNSFPLELWGLKRQMEKKKLLLVGITQDRFIKNWLNFFYQYNSELLLFIDDLWSEHLEIAQKIKTGIEWSSYKQENPLENYNTELVEAFSLLLRKFQHYLFRIFLGESLYDRF